MFQSLKIYSQILIEQLQERVQNNQIFTLRHSSHGALKNKPVHELRYQDTKKAVLLTDVDEYGEEVPVAVAFINHNSEVVVRYLADLADAE